MRFEFLKSSVRIETRIKVIQADDKSDRHTPLGHVVNESAAELFVPEWPAQGVDNTSAGGLLFWHVPHFFNARRVDLRIRILIEVETMSQLFRQRSASAFRQDRDLRANIDARFKVSFGLAGLVDS